MFDHNSNILSFEYLAEEFAITKWEYIILRSTIPKDWKRALQGVERISDISFSSKYDKLNGIKRCVSVLYNDLIDRHYGTAYLSGIINKLGKNFSVQLSEEELQQAFVGIHKVTNITKYRDFQYRLLIGLLYTNDRLFYWKKVGSQKCDYCECAKQTIKHLLYDCVAAQVIWRKLTDHMNECMKLDMAFPSVRMILLNLVHEKPHHVSNFLVLITKQIIFANKCLGMKTNFQQVLYKIVEMYKIEKYNALSTNSLSKHMVK